jgi:hypothetical protein
MDYKKTIDNVGFGKVKQAAYLLTNEHVVNKIIDKVKLGIRYLFLDKIFSMLSFLE